MSVDKTGLKIDTIEKIQDVFRKHESVETVIIYGSRAKGNYKNGSDIDLSLKGESLNLSILLKIENELDDLLLPYSFDLNIYHQIDNQDLVDHIDRVGLNFLNL